MSKLLPVVVIGFGGHGRVVASALKASGMRVIAATDLNPDAVRTNSMQIEILTDEELLSMYKPGEVLLALGVGSVGPSACGGLSRQIVESFRNLGYGFTGFQHPAAWVAEDAILAPTAQIHAGAIVQPGAMVGDFSIVNTSASLDHDTQVGAFCHIAPGATLSGNVTVGDGSHLGTGCNVIQGVKIGACCLIAAGATVVRDVFDHDSVRGVPAKSFSPRVHTND